MLKRRCDLLFFLLLLLAKSIPGQPYDLFPLSIGNRFVYEYTSFDTTYWVGTFDHSQTDSGVVVYTVDDSSLVDDYTVEWSISQIVDIQRYNKQALDWGIDSTYWVRDTVQLKLTESQLGWHQITCNAEELNDSLSISMNNEIRIWQFLDWQKVDRFSDHFEDSLITRRDSLLFRHKTGLFKRSDYFMQETHHTGPIGFRARLVDCVVGVKSGPSPDRPADHDQVINYPNPFNGSTRIEFDLMRPANVDLSVFNIRGEAVYWEAFGILPPGKQDIILNCQHLPGGLYFVRLVLNDHYILRNKFLILK